MRSKHTEKKEKRGLIQTLLFLLFPPHCAACGEAGYEELCPDCQRELEEAFSPHAFRCARGNGFADGEIVLFSYESDTVRSLIYSFKRNPFPVYPAIFQKYLQRKELKKLLPSPIHRIGFLPRRNAERKRFQLDQAEILARLSAEELGLDCETLLKRRGYARQQKGLSAKRRFRNVKGAFAATATFKGETVLLVDDVVTTGASAGECARMLKKNGAMKVYILCLAH